MLEPERRRGVERGAERGWNVLVNIERRHTVLSDPERLSAIQAIQLPDESGSVPAFERAARLAARALHAPVAQINFVTEDALVPVAVFARSPEEVGKWSKPIELSCSFCQHVVASGQPLVVSDTRKHPRTRASQAATERGIAGYMAVPVFLTRRQSSARWVVGSVCVVDAVPRLWDDEDVATLVDIAAGVTDEIAARVESRSAQKAAERQMARLLAAAGEGIIGTDAAGVMTFANAAAERLLGWTSEELVGRCQHDAIHYARPDGVPYPTEQCPLHLARSEGKSLRSADEYFLRKDGVAIPIEFTMMPVIEDGRVAGTVLTFQDISERKRSAAAERIARESAERANRAKGEFLALMSHELRTPLNAIGGYADLLDMGLRGPVTEAQRVDLARIRRSQQQLLSLINDILNFSKLEAGHVHYDMTDVALRAVVDDVVPLLSPQMTSKGLTFDTHHGDPHVCVVADRDKLQQVLVNLLGNATKFTESPGQVALDWDADADVVRIRIQDTGIGIPSQRLAQIFEPFVQFDPRLARTRAGAGLGLAISRDLARGMGGDLTVQSTVGRGSTLTLTLQRSHAVSLRNGLRHGTA